MLASACMAAGALFWFLTLPKVPFHPDESTEIYMSADLTALLSSPLSLAYPTAKGKRGHYRLVDAPLTRYLIGLGMALGHQKSLRADWNWGQTWVENENQGALPTKTQLLAARLPIATLALLGCFLLYLVGRAMDSGLVGTLAAIFTLLSPLTLLHARRAMMEGTLLFGIALTLWATTRKTPRAWLVGIAFGLAINAKPWGIGLFPAVAWALIHSAENPKAAVRRLAVALGVAAALTFALNPVAWRHPILTATEAAAERLTTTRKQMKEYQAIAPFMVPSTIGERAQIVVGHLYFAPLQFMETGNYSRELQPQIRAYQRIPLNHWGRNLTVGGILLFLSLLGILAMALKIRKPETAVVLLAGLGMGVTIILAIPLNFQRYVTPLVPFTGLWAAAGIKTLFAPKS